MISENVIDDALGNRFRIFPVYFLFLLLFFFFNIRFALSVCCFLFVDFLHVAKALLIAKLREP